MVTPPTLYAFPTFRYPPGALACGAGAASLFEVEHRRLPARQIPRRPGSDRPVHVSASPSASTDCQTIRGHLKLYALYSSGSISLSPLLPRRYPNYFKITLL